jgi:hypothetical protein
MAIIPALGRLRQDLKFEASFGYMMKLCLKQPITATMKV